MRRRHRLRQSKSAKVAVRDGLSANGHGRLYGVLHDHVPGAIRQACLTAIWGLSFGAPLRARAHDVAEAAHEVVQEAQDAGVWVFGGGLKSQKASVVATDGTVTDGPYPETKEHLGGFAVVDSEGTRPLTPSMRRVCSSASAAHSAIAVNECAPATTAHNARPKISASRWRTPRRCRGSATLASTPTRPG